MAHSSPILVALGNQRGFSQFRELCRRRLRQLPTELEYCFYGLLITSTRHHCTKVLGGQVRCAITEQHESVSHTAFKIAKMGPVQVTVKQRGLSPDAVHV